MKLPNLDDIFYTALMGFWAFLGAIMRSGTDWRDPTTKKFSYSRLLTSMATALVMGQGAVALGTSLHWDPYLIGFIASFLGYLGPAAAMALLERKFGFGGSNGKTN